MKQSWRDGKDRRLTIVSLQFRTRAIPQMTVVAISEPGAEEKGGLTHAHAERVNSCAPVREGGAILASPVNAEILQG